MIMRFFEAPHFTASDAKAAHVLDATIRAFSVLRAAETRAAGRDNTVTATRPLFPRQ